MIEEAGNAKRIWSKDSAERQLVIPKEVTGGRQTVDSAVDSSLAAPDAPLFRIAVAIERAMDFVLPPWQLLVMILAGWIWNGRTDGVLG